MGRGVMNAAHDHIDVLDPFIKPTRGEDWLSQLDRAVAGYRAAYERRIQEDAEADSAAMDVGDHVARVRAWRKYMKGVAALATDPDLERRLARATGVGLGSPRTARELKEFFDIVQPMVVAFADRFRALGALEAEIAFVDRTQAEVNRCFAALRKERAGCSVADDQLATHRAALVELIWAIDLAANIAVSRAEFTRDEAAQERAFSLRSLLDISEKELTTIPRRRKKKNATRADA